MCDTNMWLAYMLVEDRLAYRYFNKICVTLFVGQWVYRWTLIICRIFICESGSMWVCLTCTEPDWAPLSPTKEARTVLLFLPGAFWSWKRQSGFVCCNSRFQNGHGGKKIHFVSLKKLVMGCGLSFSHLFFATAGHLEAHNGSGQTCESLRKPSRGSSSPLWRA